MVKPILYGASASPAVRAVLLTTHALDLDYDFKFTNTQNNEHKTEQFLKMNPQHTIPTLDDGGKYIWDSHAIITYLVRKYAKDDSLFPKDLFTSAIVNQRLHFESSVLSQRMFGFGKAQQSGDAEQVQKAIEGLAEVYGFLEKFLENSFYMVENSLTVADFSILASLSTIHEFIPIDKDRFPKLISWMNRMQQLPYYEKANKEGLLQLLEFFKKMHEASAALSAENGKI